MLTVAKVCEGLGAIQVSEGFCGHAEAYALHKRSPVMTPNPESAHCHQTLSSQVLSGNKTGSVEASLGQVEV